MSVSSRKELLEHYTHQICIAAYGGSPTDDFVNVTVECEDCSLVLIDSDMWEQQEPRGEWVLVVRNDAWMFPDVFGPFPSRYEAELFLENHIDHTVVDVDDHMIQQLLAPEDYDDEDLDAHR